MKSLILKLLDLAVSSVEKLLWSILSWIGSLFKNAGLGVAKGAVAIVKAPAAVVAAANAPAVPAAPVAPVVAPVAAPAAAPATGS